MQGVGAVGGGAMRKCRGLPGLQVKEDRTVCAMPGCSEAKARRYHIGPPHGGHTYPICKDHWKVHIAATTDAVLDCIGRGITR